MRVEILLFIGANGKRGIRRLSHLQGLMSHFNPDYNIVKHFAYGCNCNMLVGDRPMSQPGAGQPIDELDATCHSYKSCQQCVTEKHGASCLGEFTDYSVTTSSTGATCTDAPGSCARAICECDAQFAQVHSTKLNVFNQDFNHVFGMFAYENICPDICGKSTFTVSNTESYDIDAHFNGEYLSAHKLVNGRKCYRLNDSLIQWEIDSDGTGRWVMRDNVGVKVYSRSNVACPNLAEWVTVSGSVANGIAFNGLTRGDALIGRPNSDPQCCTPNNGPFTLYNAATHVCCSDGSVARHGTC